MALSYIVNQNIQFLKGLDANKFSFTISDKNLHAIERRSAICNFFSWVIHIITFTLVPLNADLDRVTRKILKDIKSELNPEITNEEKNALEKALVTLITVIKNNAGCKEKAAGKILKKVKEIESSDPVQKLLGIKKEPTKISVEKTPESPKQVEIKKALNDIPVQKNPEASIEPEIKKRDTGEFNKKLEEPQIEKQQIVKEAAGIPEGKNPEVPSPLENTKDLLREQDLAKPEAELEESSQQLNPELIYQAQFYENLEPEACAEMVNEQINNKSIITQFFTDYFDDEVDLEKRNACVLKLKPEVFEIENPHAVRSQIWFKFFNVLKNIPNRDHAKNLLISSTKNLFNDPGFTFKHAHSFYTLHPDQISLLPIDEYTKPTIRLLIAVLSHRLDDHMIETANSLEMGNDFFEHFELAYDNEFESSKKFGLEYLKEFILWILNRDSIEPLLPTWQWVNDYPHPFLRDEIKDDTAIQDQIKRLKLDVQQPKTVRSL